AHEEVVAGRHAQLDRVVGRPLRALGILQHAVLPAVGQRLGEALLVPGAGRARVAGRVALARRRRAVDVQHALADLDAVARQADQPRDVADRGVARQAEDGDVAALGVARQAP